MDVNRLVAPQFDLQATFPLFRWNTSRQVEVTQDGVLLVDPTYLADVYNDENAVAAYVRTKGTFIYDFGGDWSGPVWLTDSYIVMPTSAHYCSLPSSPAGAMMLCDEIGCDSGSFVLLSALADLPPDIEHVVDACLKERNAAVLKVPPGTWELQFEQFEPPQANMVALYRNIVLKRIAGKTHNTA